jgi:hypothetical protein
MTFVCDYEYSRPFAFVRSARHPTSKKGKKTFYTILKQRERKETKRKLSFALRQIETKKERKKNIVIQFFSFNTLYKIRRQRNGFN